MSTNQEVPTLEQTLEKTGFGHMINENKKLILVLGAIVIAMILAYSVFVQVSATKAQEKLDEIYVVESSVFSTYLEGKSDMTAFKAGLAGITDDYIASPVLVPPFLAAINKLEDENGIDEAVMMSVEKWLGKLHKTDYLYLFMALRVSALYEDQGDSKKAISLLEGLSAQKSDLLKDKVSYELGRLYLSEGNKADAQSKFDAVLKDYPDSEYAKLAKMYMGGL